MFLDKAPEDPTGIHKKLKYEKLRKPKQNLTNLIL